MKPDCVWYWETWEDYVKSEGRLGGTKTAVRGGGCSQGHTGKWVG